ncbi:hypothetical protein [Paeniglutamicibacter antarcticus]|uniref:Uncharacterized protein n=1 Tax=Paeniglutamicibacter antarcticus TaxID=494023 RepID=A0ABP9TJV8_9MICC
MNAANNRMNESEARDIGQGAQRFASAVASPAAWAFVWLILRIFAVSGYDWNTAFAVSTTLSPSDGLALLFGSLMAGHVLVAILMIVVLPLLIASYAWSPRGHRPLVMLGTTLGVVTLVALTVSFREWWLPVASAAVFAVFALIHILSPKNPVRRAFMAIMSRIGWVSGIAIVLVAAVVQTPWVPQEQIETTDRTITAYVLSVDSGYLNILTEDHKFEILISSDVISRK